MDRSAACLCVVGPFAPVLIDIADKDEPISQHLFTWIPSGSFNVDVNLYADQLTAVFADGRDDCRLPRTRLFNRLHGRRRRVLTFFSYLPLFVFSMLMLVLADNYLLLFVFGKRLVFARTS